jgi:hypothetical protein
MTNRYFSVIVYNLDSYRSSGLSFHMQDTTLVCFYQHCIILRPIFFTVWNFPKTERHAQMSYIEESVTDNCHFQRKGNENQYTHSVNFMSKLKEVCSILENSDMKTLVFSDLVFLSALDNARFNTFLSSESSVMTLFPYSSTTF